MSSVEKRTEIESAVIKMELEASRFASKHMMDARSRSQCMRNAKNVSNQIKSKLKAGEISDEEAVNRAQGLQAIYLAATTIINEIPSVNRVLVNPKLRSGQMAHGSVGNKNPYMPGFKDFVELFIENAKEVIKIDLGVEAAYGPGSSALGQTNLSGDVRYTVTYSKGIILKPVGSLSAEVYSSGEINGFFQALEFCAVGCVDVKWNYVHVSVGTSIGPNAGFSFKSGVTNKINY